MKHYWISIQSSKKKSQNKMKEFFSTTNEGLESGVHNLITTFT
ncbi:unnamed protein product [Brassica oleracea]